MSSHLPTQLRVYEQSDLEQVHRLIQRTIDRNYPPVYPPRAVGYFKEYHSREAIARRAATGTVLVLEDEIGIVATGSLVGDELTGVFVAPESQWQGLGAIIMDELEATALRSGISTVRLSVSLPSRGFYERRGYRFSPLLSDDVGEGQHLDHWEAEKSLPGPAVVLATSSAVVPPAEPAPAGRAAAPWSVRDVWLGVVAAAVLVAVVLGVLYGFPGLTIEMGADLWIAIIPTLLELLFLVPVVWFVKVKHKASFRTLGFTKFKASILGVGLGLFVSYYLFAAVYAALLQRFQLQVQPSLNPVLDAVGSPWPLVFTTVIVAPFVEEVFFRGFIFNGLRKRFHWAWAAAISSALFAGAHLELTFFIPAFALGYLFAFLYHKTDSVWPGMAFHFLLNGIAMTVLLTAT